MTIQEVFARITAEDERRNSPEVIAEYRKALRASTDPKAVAWDYLQMEWAFYERCWSDLRKLGAPEVETEEFEGRPTDLQEWLENQFPNFRMPPEIRDLYDYLYAIRGPGVTVDEVPIIQ